MNDITFGPGVFFMATMDEIRESLQEAEEGLKALLDKIMGFGTLYQEFAAMAVPGYCPTLEEIERAGWRGAAALARSRPLQDGGQGAGLRPSDDAAEGPSGDEAP